MVGPWCIMQSEAFWIDRQAAYLSFNLLNTAIKHRLQSDVVLESLAICQEKCMRLRVKYTDHSFIYMNIEHKSKC